MRVQVSATEWKTESLEVHMNIRALLVKTFARDTSELRGGFAPVPVGMSLAQGLALLNQSELPLDAQNPSRAPARTANSLLSSSALTIHP